MKRVAMVTDPRTVARYLAEPRFRVFAGDTPSTDTRRASARDPRAVDSTLPAYAEWPAFEHSAPLDL
jgi:hypothetical protein